MKSILIFTSSFDLTVDYLIDKYSRIHDFFRINVDRLDDYLFDVSETGIYITLTGYWKILVSDAHAIYYRKISFPNLNNKYNKKYHPFIYKEIYTLITGIVETFEGICLTKPSILRLAENKIYQIKIAKEVDFLFPESLISNNTNSINQFCALKKRIVKPIASGKIEKEGVKDIVQTNILNDNISIRINDICPAYYQAYIDKDFDLRVTIINNDVFPVKIISKNNVDWRKDHLNTKYNLVTIPEEIISKCYLFLNKINMNFGVFDFVVKNNKYYFLEVNPNGQWGWLEKELNINISDAIIKYLIGGIL